MKIRELLSEDESSLFSVSAVVEKLKSENEYKAILRIFDDNSVVTLDFFIGSAAEKEETIHTLRRFKRIINTFYNAIKEIPEEEFASEEE